MADGGLVRSIASRLPGSDGEGVPSRRRLALLTGILLAHAAVLAAVAIQHMPAPVPTGSGRGLVVIEVAKPVAPATKVVPQPRTIVTPAPIVITPQKPPPIAISYPQMSATEAAAVVAGGCDLTEPVRQALQQDARARSAILGLPVASRSVANAVMLWDGRWVGGSPDAVQPGLATIRASILATIASAPAECRAQEQTGPRLISIPGPPDITLALGSGHWRWGDLAADEREQQVASTGDPAGTTLFDRPKSGSRSGT